MRVLAQRRLHGVEVGDVAVHERDAVLDVVEVLAVAGVGERVERDDVVVGVLRRPSDARSWSR